MAEKLDAESANRASNANARSEAFQQTLEHLYQKDKKIDELMESSGIKALRQDKRDIKKKLKKDHEIPVKAVNRRYLSYRDERRAKETGDDVLADLIREAWEMCPVGSSVDLVAVAEAAG